DDIFHLVVRNALVYTLVSEVFKLALGLLIAHLLVRTFRLRGVVRALLLLPWIVPTVLSALAWSWIYDPTFGVLNWSLKHFGLVAEPPNWRFASPWPMISLIIVNVWRGTPFFALSFLGAMQGIPAELYEAAQLDGAGAWKRLLHVTLPMLRPVALTVTLLTTIVTFADFQLVHILTGGGPANQTQVFSTYAYQVGLAGGDIGRGAAVSLSMFPILSALAFSVILLIRRDK
ncbi:MAG: sugar ABC transporter permease, partial [Rhodospirillales bacterium]|nr:sugar ABC transporter permease [Rhodospirillales bacterium]